MSKINKSQDKFINNINDVYDLYLGTGKSLDENYIGTETEDCLYQKINGSKKLISKELHDQIFEQLDLQGIKASQEGTYSVIETKTRAQKSKFLEYILEDNDSIEEKKNDIFCSMGIQKCSSAFLPEMTIDMCLQNAVQDERIQSLIKATSKMYGENALKHGMMTTSVHVSFEYSDPFHLMNVMRRGSYLSPFLSQLCQNDTGYEEGMFFDGNRSAVLRDSYGSAGGVQEFIFQTNDPDEFISKHSEMIFKTPMLFYYNKDGSPVVGDKANLSFGDLKKCNLNTHTNYTLAESLKYHDMKLTNIRNNIGERTGARVEVRMASNGSFQHDTMLLLSNAIFLNKNIGEDVDKLLEDFGFKIEVNSAMHQSLLKTRHDVQYHQGKHMDINYGSRKMTEFSKNFSEIIQKFYKDTDCMPRLKDFLDICKTGNTQAKKNLTNFYQKMAI